MKRKGFSPILIILITVVLVVGGLIAFNQLSQRGAQEATSQERKFVALGDSLTKANNLSSSLKGDNPEYSFSTGSRIESAYQYLKNKGEKLTSVNLASSGAASADILSRQVPNVAGYSPKYITLLTGGPDIGLGVSSSTFADNLKRIVAQIKKGDTIILIGTLPNITKIRSASYPACKENKIGLKMENFTEEKIKEFNRIITEVAKQNNLILVDLYESLGAGDASDYDCLHPNVEGQKKLAKAWISALEKATQIFGELKEVRTQ